MMMDSGIKDNLAWHRTLAFKVAVAACAILALTAILLNFAAYSIGRDIIRYEIHERLHAAATDRQQMVLAYTGQQQERVGLVASRTRLRAVLEQYIDGSIDVAALHEETQPNLDDARQSADGFVDVWICDPSGRVITATDDRYLEADYSSDPTFELGKRQKYLSDLTLIDDTYHAYLAAPARTDDGRLIAVVMVLVDATPLVDILRKPDGLGETGEVLIATQEADRARLLVPRRGQETSYFALSSAPAMAAALRGDTSEGVAETEFDGVDILAEYRPVRIQENGSRPWGLVARIDVAEAYQPIKNLSRKLTLVGLVVLVFAIVASIVLTALATRPLRMLTVTATRIASGDLDARAAVTSRDECGVLTHAFNQMADHLVALHADLEERVTQRTEDLSHSETKFRELFESTRDAIVVLADGRFVDANQSALEIFGCETVEEFRQFGPIDLSPATQPCGGVSSDLAAEHIDRALREGSDFFEWVHRRTGGTEFTSEVLLSVIDNKATPILQATVRDVTERKAAKIALEKSETRIRSLLDSTAEAIYGLDLHGNCTFANAACLRMLGYEDVGDLLGQNMHNLIHHTRCDGTPFAVEACSIYKAFQNGQGAHVDSEVLWRADGTSFPAEYWSHPIFIAGQVTGAVVTFLDITERREVEKALTDSVEKTRAILNSTSDGIVTIDERGTIEAVNPAIERIFGYTADELLGSNVNMLMPAPYQDEHDQYLARYLQTGEKNVIGAVREVVGKRKDGTSFPMELSVTEVVLNDRRLFTGSVRDITERKQAEESIRRSEERFDLAMRGSSDGLWDWNLETDEVYYSPRWKSMLGYCEEEVEPHFDAALRLIHPEDKQHLLDVIEQYLSGESENFEVEMRMRHKDGHDVFILSRGFAVRGEGNSKSVRMVGTHVDLTEWKRREEQLNRFKTTLDQTLDCVFMFRPNTLQFYYVNQGAIDQVGYSADELMQMTAPDIKPEYTEEEFRALLAPLIQGKQDLLRIETIHRHKDGHDIPVEVSLQYVSPDEETPRFVAVVRDIAVRKQSELALLEAKEEAERANVAKSQFLAGMSHELRTPLNGVIGMTELLAGTELSGKQRQFVDACRNSGESLLQLINDILDFSKIEAGKLDLDFHDFDLEQLVTDTVETMAWRAIHKTLEMPCYVDQVSRLVLKGDSNRLRQILVNLLGNAVKFTETGEVVVRTKTVSRQDDRITIRFSVSDTGIGIPKDKLDRLFQSFSQVDTSTTREYGGTGLGLAISQSLVELMNGRIGVETEEGVGSTFWFEVPFAVVSESTEDRPDTSPLVGQRALIVDDNETNRIILAEYSTGWGLDSVTTASVDEALAAVDRAEADGSPFHMVLTDYNMPQRNGLELARALKQHPQLVVLLLGSTDIHLNPDELREQGIDAVLRKPLRRNELHEVLCGVIAAIAAETKLSEAADNKSAEMVDTVPLSGHILLAEDNSINQMYMVELMKQLGCTCETVGNGHEAIKAVQQHTYDVVLMDCQMPEMDGFEATRRIRQLEADGLVKGHLPIVALTANAVKGDRQRCLDAGMDDYLSKPVQKHQVISVLQRFFRDAQEPSQETRATIAVTNEAGEQSEPAPIDSESLLARCFGNLDFACSLLDELESTGWERVEEIRQQAGQENSTGTAEAAHALKGAAGILCAESVEKLAAEIEHAGRSADLDDIEATIQELSCEMQRCLKGLPQLRKKVLSLKQESE